jgi:hypothetical protein
MPAAGGRHGSVWKAAGNEEVKREAKRRKVELIEIPTSKAITGWPVPGGISSGRDRLLGQPRNEPDLARSSAECRRKLRCGEMLTPFFALIGALRRGRTTKLKGLRHWLRSSRQLLRGNSQRGCMHRRSPLMRSPLSRFQTPTAPRRSVGFFGFGCPASCLTERITQPTSDQQRFIFANPFSRRRERK